MDQNACSSPRMIIWYGSEKQTKVAKNKFWPILYEIVKRKYSLEKTNVIQKFTDLCEFAIQNNKIPIFIIMKTWFIVLKF